MFTRGRVADPLTLADIAITLALAAEVALDRIPGLLARSSAGGPLFEPFRSY